MYRGWTQRDYQNKHYNINQKDEGTLDDRGRDGGTNFILRIKEQETRLILQEHDDDDDDDDGGGDKEYNNRAALRHVILSIDTLRTFCHLSQILYVRLSGLWWCNSSTILWWLKNKNQLEATYYFIVLLIRSTCFGHYYAQHQWDGMGMWHVWVRRGSV